MKQLLISLAIILTGSFTVSHPFRYIGVPTSYYDTVKSINPKLSHNDTVLIIHNVFKQSIKFGLDKDLMLSILAQESAFKLSAKSTTNDHGMAQINKHTIKRYNLNKNKLHTDIEYNTYAMSIVLNDFKKLYSHKEKDWYTRYNSPTKFYRMKYKARLNKFYKRFKALWYTFFL